MIWLKVSTYCCLLPGTTRFQIHIWVYLVESRCRANQSSSQGPVHIVSWLRSISLQPVINEEFNNKNNLNITTRSFFYKIILQTFQTSCGNWFNMFLPWLFINKVNIFARSMAHDKHTLHFRLRAIYSSSHFKGLYTIHSYKDFKIFAERLCHLLWLRKRDGLQSSKMNLYETNEIDRLQGTGRAFTRTPISQPKVILRA